MAMQDIYCCSVKFRIQNPFILNGKLVQWRI